MKRQIGSVRERPAGSGRWTLKWYVKEEGRSITKTVSARNETEARKILGKLAGEYVPKVSMDSDKLTVSELLEKYLLDFTATQLRRTTYQTYQAIIRNRLIPRFGNIQANELDAGMIAEYYNWALNNGRSDGTGGLSAQSVQHIHRVLHRAFKIAVRRKWLKQNPIVDVDLPEVKVVEMQTLNSDQLAELLELVRGTKWELPILIGAFTGMRRGEILGLKWDCVALDRKTITVMRSLEEVKEGLFLGDTKTGSSRRTIPITATLIAALERQKAAQDTLKKELGELYRDEGYVCAEQDGKPMRPKNLSLAFRAISDKSGLPRIRFHDLSRHTIATIMLGSGEHAKVVQEHLGHANFGVTMDTYSHVSVRMSRDAIERYDKCIQDAAAKRRICGATD